MEPDGTKTDLTPSKEKKTPAVRVAKSVYRRELLRRWGKLFTGVFLSLFVVYVCFAATILRVLPASNGQVFVPVKNSTYRGEIAPVGASLVVNMKESQGDGMLQHLRQAFWPNPNIATVEVLAGPYGRINWSPILTTVDGKPIIGVRVLTPPTKESKGYLNNDYVVKCLSGACKPGAGYIVSAKNVYGQPVK